MKILKAILGTVAESLAGPQQLSLRNLEAWDNLWQVIIALQRGKNAHVHLWECFSKRAFERGDFELSIWNGEKIYADDLLVTMEFVIDRPNQLAVYIRRAYAKHLQTPVEERLKIDPLVSQHKSRPYVYHFTDFYGNLEHSYSVFEWTRLLELWTNNGILQPLIQNKT